MNQVVINKASGVCKTICAHYHKTGWSDVFSKMIPHPAVIVIDDDTEEQAH